MISYKYKLYRTPKTKYLDQMLEEACFVWNHALALQRRYYRMYHKYIGLGEMKHHFAKRIKRNLLHTHTRQEILERLDMSYQRFFMHLAKRPPKFKKEKDYNTVHFKGCGGYSLDSNVLKVNRIKKKYKFSLSRPYDGMVKMLTIKRSRIGEYYIVLVLNKVPVNIGKTHNGASVGIDFGLKTYMTLSDGVTIKNPQFHKRGLTLLKSRSRKFSKCICGSNNQERKRLELDRLYEKFVNQRNDFQWKLAHRLCRQYDTIFLEDLKLTDMSVKWGRKIADLAHGDFVLKLTYIASKYGVTIHKIDRFYPSSKICTCGYRNNGLQLYERVWQCPICGEIHKRDLLAAKNICRQGIVELKSACKTQKSNKTTARTRLYSRIHS